MIWPLITKLLILVLTIFVVGYNYIAYFFHGEDATISYIITEWAEEAPVIILLIGLVLGHWFWRF